MVESGSGAPIQNGFVRAQCHTAGQSFCCAETVLGKLDFYLEALDRNERKPHENPAIGVLLCASKDDEVVEYALNRSLSPALIAEYQTYLPDKALLQAKLHEFYALDTAHDPEQ
ncbi:hypothetical protein PS3A_00180 [Pseudomonas sp. 3A(2025)]